MTDNNGNPILLNRRNIQSAVKYFRRKRITLLIAGLLGLAFGIFYSSVKKPLYTANITFSLEEEDKSGGSLLSLASQFGLDLGGSTNSLFSGDNIIDLFSSRRIVENALLQPYANTNRSFADAFLDISGMRNNAGLPKNFFPLNSNTTFSRLQDSIIGAMHQTITKAFLYVDKPDKKLDIYEVSFKSNDEQFSKLFAEDLVNEVSNFYAVTKTKKAKYNVDILQKRVDSIYGVYKGALFSRADLTDANVNPAFQVPQVGIQEKQTEITVMGTAYGELLKNLELAKYTLLKETPLLQIIDSPVYPLEKKEYPVWLYVPLGMFGFIFLTLCFLLFFKLIRKVYQWYFR